MTTVFGKIIKGELSAEKIFENERIIVIKDLYPVAPVHLLIIPKKEISNLQSIQQEDLELVSEIVVIAQQLAKQFNIEEGYRLVTNNGAMAGQVIFHLHFHLIGGRQLGSLG
ncbi:histidine triad nucleotide-binding protein [Candidatus Protochlamydia sp. W-9]|uniref:histidine triad nucleotide-binding protein n=1 Tax=Candidatus Protochlamydia sp. W-9 TaxID=1785087 RepID=UPI00096A2665|nr:histidine triad nucleotide-binding protein [Candidatus Protochlamydia sp. W-9]